jgi:hypothetical protein
VSSAVPQFEVGATVLGYVGLVASWRRMSAAWISKQPPGGPLYPPVLTIYSCADTDEGVHTPAATVTILTREGLIALREAIDEALKNGGAA